MEKNYSTFIDRFLRNTAALKPIPTELAPAYNHKGTVKAVIFDVYGTMLISASGDIEESEISTSNVRKALEAADISIVSVNHEVAVLNHMLDSFKREIHSVHINERSAYNPYPEVNILEIWSRILKEQSNKNELKINDELCVKCFTFVFEVLSNNIYPMPGMKDVIRTLKSKGIPLGIISNAQFYTPVILNFFLDNPVDDPDVSPFDPELTILSYQFKRSKPDHYLFELIRSRCKEKYDIPPGQILFVGNDMFRDIYPAFTAGFKTALFAGDKRSLRLRSENPAMNELNPDYVITDLRQIFNIIGL
jgi:putative hydrolase of the HAD superfamily